MKIFIQFSFIVFISILFTGCVSMPETPNSLGKKQFNLDEEKFEDLDKLSCQKLSGKNIYINFTTKQNGNFLELYNPIKKEIEKIQYKGDFSKDFTDFLSHNLTKYCNSNIVGIQNTSTLNIIGNIDKYYIQDQEYTNKSNEKISKTKTQSVLAVDYNINNKKYLFANKLTKISTFGDKTLSNDTTNGTTYKAESFLNNQSIPYSLHLVVIDPNNAKDAAGFYKRFDSNGKEVKKIEFTASEMIEENNSKRNIVQLNKEIGLLKQLMYRYLKDLVEDINEQI